MTKRSTSIYTLTALLLSGTVSGDAPAPPAPATVVRDTSPVVWSAGSDVLRVQVHQDGGYSVLRSGSEWLTSAATALYRQGAWYSSRSDNSNLPLKPTGAKTVAGRDALGTYTGDRLTWDASGTSFVTTVRVYPKRDIIVFAQDFPEGVEDPAVAGTPRPAVLSAFPCFQDAGRVQSLRSLTYNGTFAGAHRGTGLADFHGGTDGGVPLVLIDPAFRTLVLSPLNHFKAGVQTHAADLGGALACGVQGQIRQIPKGFTQETILTAGQGVNASLYDWGSDLLSYHGKTRQGPGRDMTVKMLGYWTDNGAYYYYHTEPGKNYEQTLLDAHADHVQSGLPFHYYQLDSWWYFKGPDQGVARWEARPDVFPDGVAGVHQKLGLPLVMHNRWWSPTTAYARTYPFVVDASSAIPVTPPFWDYLMARNKKEGCQVYEQDWLVDQYHKAPVLRQDADAADQWLHSMGAAAARQGMTIQYCMPLPADLLESSELPAVTQTRVSGDYHPGNRQWRVGATSLLAWSLGLAPFKDTFWTTADEPGSPYGTKAREPNTQLETLVSALSAGPIGPGDAIGKTNVPLLIKTCRRDGLLLKPDKPATPLDRWFVSEEAGEIWDAETTFGPNHWHYVLAAALRVPWSLTPADLDSSGPAVVYNPDTGTVVAFDSTHPPALACADRGPGAVPFGNWVIAPRSTQGWAFLGETDKFITVSHQRFANISADGLRVIVQGTPGEPITLQWSAPNAPSRVTAGGRPLAASFNAATHLLTAHLPIPPFGRVTVAVEARN